MIYLSTHGLRELPFRLTPDPRYLYFTPSHREVMANLHYGIDQGKGLIVVTGEAGTGKTTLLRAMLARLDRSVLTAGLNHPRLTVDDFYRHLAADFNLDAGGPRADLLRNLGKLLATRHARGWRTLLVVDEAHGLSVELLEEIRLLLNFETYTEKQLQIVLAGQPELRRLLNSPALRQLKQRISLRCEIKPLRAPEVTAYIRHRLTVAGAERIDLFTTDAEALIYRWSEGIPRLVNNLCDNALLTAYAAKAERVTAEIVSEVAASLDLGEPAREAAPDEAMTDATPAWPIFSEGAERELLAGEPREESWGRPASLENHRRRKRRT